MVMATAHTIILCPRRYATGKRRPVLRQVCGMLQLTGLDSKPSKKAALEQMVSQAVNTCLIRPLAEAAVANNRQAQTALAQAWIAYLASMQAKYNADEPFLISTAAKLIELLASLGSSKTSGGAAPDSGSAPGNDLGLSQGEMPHAQAAVLYVIRVSVMEQLSETGQVRCCVCLCHINMFRSEAVLYISFRALAKSSKAAARNCILILQRTKAALIRLVNSQTSSEGFAVTSIVCIVHIFGCNGLQQIATRRAVIPYTQVKQHAADLVKAQCLLQRALLERLTGLVSTPVGDAVPAGVVALEAMRLIVEVVGEVSSDEVHQMRQPCITKLTAHPQPLQAQVPSPGLAFLLHRSKCL